MPRALLFFALWAFSVPSCAQPVIRLGISEFAPGSINTPIISKTVGVIKESLPGYEIQVQTLSVAKLQSSVLNGQLDLVLSSAGFYRKMCIMGAGLHDLTTVASERFPDPNYADGSVFVTLAENSSINSLKDLKGQPVAASHGLAFGGWYTALGEIDKQGYEADSFFGPVHFKGHEMGDVVKALQNGEVPAIILKTCFLEDNRFDLSRFKVVHRNNDERFTRCVNSTDLFPNWTLSTLPSISPEVSRKITVALMAMPTLEHGLHWGIATDFTGIDRLYQRLKVGPYEYLRKFNLLRFVRQYWEFIAGVLLLIGALCWHSRRVSVLVEKRTAELQEALLRQESLKKEVQKISDRYAEIQKQGVINQISSIFAHEMRQPLGSISTYSYGLLRGLDTGNLSKERAKAILEKLIAQSERASDIVEKVRGYAKGNRERTLIDVGSCVRNSIQDLQKTTRFSRAVIEQNIERNLYIRANALEIELIVVNLVKNAVESYREFSPEWVDVAVFKEGERVLLRVKNSGAYITEEQWQNIVQGKISSTKKFGLGLGLAVVRNLAEDLGGGLQFFRNAEGGLSVEVSFPQDREVAHA